MAAESGEKRRALGEALTLAYQITGDEWYRTRLAKCAKFFRTHWRVKDDHVEWNYRDHAFASDYVSGKLGEGDTKTGATKPATVETGAVANVPLFVEEGEKIKVDTRSGEYIERVKG